MAIIRNYTTVEQSRKLAKFLLIESADGWWTALNWQETEYYIEVKQDGIDKPKKCVPCWSLSALLNLLPNCTDIVKEEADTENEKYMCTVGVKDDIICTFGNNPVDACVAMIEKLHEFNLL